MTEGKVVSPVVGWEVLSAEERSDSSFPLPPTGSPINWLQGKNIESNA